MDIIKKSWIPITFTLTPMIGGFIGGIFVRKNIKVWYETLNRPSWRPPNYMFAPVWTILYLGMGYASFMVYQSGGGFFGKIDYKINVLNFLIIIINFFNYRCSKTPFDIICITTGFKLGMVTFIL
ncbi:Hypothetical protein CINCED_3A018081 [Cinara cedri]|uniref:TspO/MBR-related protein n=1 Tax=Cinara cedri TaxID=506608 RepID=A0A5E4N7C9_9HEMI|nr:Hypothetical protein CINCED_3A018081 [Cinara cedri]